MDRLQGLLRRLLGKGGGEKIVGRAAGQLKVGTAIEVSVENHVFRPKYPKLKEQDRC